MRPDSVYETSFSFTCKNKSTQVTLIFPRQPDPEAVQNFSTMLKEIYLDKITGIAASEKAPSFLSSVTENREENNLV